MTDPIADMLTRIRNAYLTRHTQVVIPHSRLKESLAKKIQSMGYLESVVVNTDNPQKTIVAKLKYINKLPVITEINRISKPGRRVYSTSSQIKTTLSGHGMTLITTSQGILSDKEARKQKLGGEVLCQIW